LLAARRLDGGEQFFTRARDFRLLQSAEENAEIWGTGKPSWAMSSGSSARSPDVIITRFSPTQTNTHGHHTASAILALEAFQIGEMRRPFLSSSPRSTPGTKRILQNSGFGGAMAPRSAWMSPVRTLSSTCPTPRSPARARAMHKSPKARQLAGAGAVPAASRFTLLAGEPAATDIMDGRRHDVKRYNIADDIDGKIAAVTAKLRS